MLVALDENGYLAEAARDLAPGTFSCPACDGPVLLKRGRVKVAHFAHSPGAECWSEHESVSHLRAKQILAEQFRRLGYEVRLEETYRDQRRRIDVAVTVSVGTARHRVAVEVQDSAISVDTMKSRTKIDKFLGFLGTTWVFTDKRASALLSVADMDTEVKIPNEMLWVDNRYGQGIFVLDLDDERMWNIELGMPDARINEWYDENGDERSSAYLPRTLRRPSRLDSGFALMCKPGRFREWAVVFTDS